MRAFAPNGSPILGTSEVVACRAEISSFSRNENGELEYEYAGDTEVFWDEQKTLQRNGKDLFLSSDGHEYTEDELTFVEDDELTENDWQAEMRAGDTKLGYDEWIAHQLEARKVSA